MSWRAERNSLGLLFFVCLVIGALFVWLMPGCASSQLYPCTGGDAVANECKGEQRKRGCADDPQTKCPDLVKACEDRIDAMTDEEICP